MPIPTREPPSGHPTMSFRAYPGVFPEGWGYYSVSVFGGQVFEPPLPPTHPDLIFSGWMDANGMLVAFPLIITDNTLLSLTANWVQEPIPPAQGISGSFILPNAVWYVAIELRQNTADGLLFYTYNIPLEQADITNPLSFAFNDIPVGIYSLVFRQPGHTAFTINNIDVADINVDLTQNPNFPQELPLRPGNVTGNGQVNIIDLAALLQNWMGDYENANLTGSGQVNIADLTLLLQNWMAENVTIN